MLSNNLIEDWVILIVLLIEGSTSEIYLKRSVLVEETGS